ncbi:hypothetical protein [Simonsiella muelleri]|uniref:hypothetical protein n=1 Tax=Simonsiella muelleri TaxID=72 RepID=UPI0023F418CA|nr:hypothetical protein [Simonsiella muelleri]
MSDKEIILKPINRVVQPTDAEIQLQPITDDSIGYAAPVAQTTDETVDTSGVNWWGFFGGLVGVDGFAGNDLNWWCRQ